MKSSEIMVENDVEEYPELKTENEQIFESELKELIDKTNSYILFERDVKLLANELQNKSYQLNDLLDDAKILSKGMVDKTLEEKILNRIEHNNIKIEETRKIVENLGEIIYVNGEAIGTDPQNFPDFLKMYFPSEDIQKIKKSYKEVMKKNDQLVTQIEDYISIKKEYSDDDD